MAEYPYYPYQWSLQPDCSTNMKVQNKDGKKPASCEEIIPTGGDDNCGGYVGYYPDDSGSSRPTPAFHHCTNNTFSDGCRDALFRPKGCRLEMNVGSKYDFSDKSAWETLGWTCEKPPDDLRTKIPSTYFPVNPRVNEVTPAGYDGYDIVMDNMCGNRWGNEWAMRCKENTGRTWPKCNTVKDDKSCNEVIGCKWLESHDECVRQTCQGMIQNDLICDSQLCNWDPSCDDPYTCGPSGPPPRGFTARGKRREV